LTVESVQQISLHQLHLL